MDNANVNLAQFMDENGKIIISDDMPADLKEAINYLNENNVNLFTKIDDVEVSELDDDEDLEDELDLDDDSDEEDDLDDDFELDDDLDDDLDENDSSNVEELNNLF